MPSPFTALEQATAFIGWADSQKPHSVFYGIRLRGGAPPPPEPDDDDDAAAAAASSSFVGMISYSDPPTPTPAGGAPRGPPATGVVLAPRHQGAGYAGEARAAVLGAAWALGPGAPGCVEAETAAGNAAAIRSLLRSGYVLVGRREAAGWQDRMPGAPEVLVYRKNRPSAGH